MVTVNWLEGQAFEAEPPTGSKFVMDAYPEDGKKSRGPTPVEALLASIGACSAIDVLSILQKKRQTVTAYRVEVDGERTPEGEYPRPFKSLVIRHIVSGENLDPAAVERAVELSDQKYCSVIATLRAAPSVTSEFVIEDAVGV
ncbi:MAG TPA: OsmC family protein [Fimbriimonadaceae bacterium]|nr:OsmC family protein [Fimbriimonadaceae bacterium]